MILALLAVARVNPQKVSDVLRHHNLSLGLRNSEEDRIREMRELWFFTRSDNIVAAPPKLLSDDGGVHRVEEQPHRQAEVRCERLFTSASVARRSFLAIQASTSSVYSA